MTAYLQHVVCVQLKSTVTFLQYIYAHNANTTATSIVFV
jgi:hypothetical protein